MVPCRPYFPFVAAFCGLAACGALAADPAGDPVSKLRNEWRSQVVKDTKVLREHYAQNLRDLEKKLASRGDYSGAAKVREERLKVSSGAGDTESPAHAVPKPVEEGQPIVLEAAQAIVTSGVGYNSALGALTGWNAGTMVSWLLPPGLKGGGYEIELTWSCPQENTGGQLLILKEDRYSLRRAIGATSSWDIYQTSVIGTLRLIANSRMLELSVAAASGAAVAANGSDLLHLKSIRLLPVVAGK